MSENGDSGLAKVLDFPVKIPDRIVELMRRHVPADIHNAESKPKIYVADKIRQNIGEDECRTCLYDLRLYEKLKKEAEAEMNNLFY